MDFDLELSQSRVGFTPRNTAPKPPTNNPDLAQRFSMSENTASGYKTDYVSLIANRILFAPAYTILYILLFLFQLVLFIYGMSQYLIFRELTEHDLWYVISDVCVTILLCVEVVIRALATRHNFWASWINVLDFIVMVLCLLALLFYFLDPQTAIYGSLILSVRYGAQLLRLCCMLKGHRDRKSMVKSMDNEVDFTNLETEDVSFDQTTAALERSGSRAVSVAE